MDKIRKNILIMEKNIIKCMCKVYILANLGKSRGAKLKGLRFI